MKKLPGVLLFAMLLPFSPALAYYNTTDKAEAVTIMPNESAFWIPDTGANMDTQASLDSEEFLKSKKIALKRFIIPHSKFNNSGGWYGFDAYVPTGRMIIVDRAPYNRDWVESSQRGTSVKDESFPCQTKDGLNIWTEISIGVSVTEENAPKFLHFFGVNNPTGDRSSPDTIFTSVYYGRSLTQVMDGPGRGEIHIQVCKQFGTRTFDQANEDGNTIMEAVVTSATKWLSDRGITVDYLGWGGTFRFDPDVQKAVNDRYTGEKVKPVLEALQTKAMVDAIEGWNHVLPTSINLSWWPSSLGDAIKGLFHDSSHPATTQSTPSPTKP